MKLNALIITFRIQPYSKDSERSFLQCYGHGQSWTYRVTSKIVRFNTVELFFVSLCAVACLRR